MSKTIFSLFLFSILSLQAYTQNTIIEGYVFESGNRGYLNAVDIKVFAKNKNQLIGTAISDINGFFSLQVPIEKNYVIETNKTLFNTEQTKIVVKKKDKNKKVFTKIKMFRKPGYIFEVTLAEMMVPGLEEVDAIVGAKIEVFNNTANKSLLNLSNHPYPTFKVNFERGNHYTLLIRKDGYFTKRLEAYVDIKDCILCFEGVGNVQPGVSEVLTEDNQMGTLLANIELRPLMINQPSKLQDVTFETGSSRVNEVAQKELDKLLVLIKDNPDLAFEISAHSDARGAADYNVQLSLQRANSAVKYLLDSKKIQANQLVAKGYGAAQLLNHCKNGVVCPEGLHQQNRRVEWKILNQKQPTFSKQQSLAQILEVERFNQDLVVVKPDNQLVNKAGDILPPNLAKDVKKYGIDDQKIVLSANPDGVPLAEVITTTDPYAEVTNATRLTEENYDEASHREVLKREKVPTVYSVPPVNKVISSTPRNLHPHEMPTPYKKIPTVKEEMVRSNRIGETVVSVARSNKAPTKQLPINYTGYKVEFMTAMIELDARHKIFSQHGNITMEQQPNGVYSYLLGDFQEQKDAALFLKEVMLPRYSNAILIYFNNGKRGRQVAVNGQTTPSSAPPR